VSTNRPIARELAHECDQRGLPGRTARDGRLAGLAEGTEVLIEPATCPGTRIGIDETEWSDDPADLRDWEAWIKTIEPPILTDDEHARMAQSGRSSRSFDAPGGPCSKSTS
jgi:hypothetical protein